MTYTLVINPHPSRATVTKHDSLRDARAALIQYFSGRGLHLNIEPWQEDNGFAIQCGQLMSGMDSVGVWAISYPLEDGAELPPYQVERISA